MKKTVSKKVLAGAPDRKKSPAEKAVAKKNVAKKQIAKNTSGALLPEAFSELEPFVGKWAVTSAMARLQRRIDSTAEERISFYHAMVPMSNAALEYLDSMPFDANKMQLQDRNLMQLMLSVAEVSLTEEVNGQSVEAIHAQSNRTMYFTKENDCL